MKKRVIAHLLLDLFILFACTPKDAQREEQFDIFKSSSCNLPCWNGVVVGHTTEADLISNLNNLSIVNKEFLGPNVESGAVFEKTYSFRIGEKDDNGQFPSLSFAYIRNGIVQEIDFAGGFELAVSEATGIFGIPEFVFTAYTHSGKLDIRLFFPGKGTIISLTKSQKSANISENDLIESIQIISPSAFDSIVNDVYASGGQLLKLYDWNGFGNILEKYPP